MDQYNRCTVFYVLQEKLHWHRPLLESYDKVKQGEKHPSSQIVCQYVQMNPPLKEGKRETQHMSKCFKDVKCLFLKKREGGQTSLLNWLHSENTTCCLVAYNRTQTRGLTVLISCQDGDWGCESCLYPSALSLTARPPSVPPPPFSLLSLIDTLGV